MPDEVIDAIGAYLRTSNANVGGPFETSARTVSVIDEPRTAGRFLGCAPEEVTFGANMTSLSFALSRTAGEGFEPGDEIVVTRLDHDGNVAPGLELADDPGLVLRFVDITDDCDVDLADLERQLSAARASWRSTAFERRRHAHGRGRIVELAHGAGALAWADAVHAAPRADRRLSLGGRRRPPLLALQVLRAASRRCLRQARDAEGWRHKVRPRSTSRSATASRRGRSRSSSSPASSPRSSTSSPSAGPRSRRTSGRWASDSWRGCPRA